MKYAYLVVEGPHDAEFVGRLLKPLQFNRVTLDAALDPYWRSLVPSKFPFGGKLNQRVPVPTFFASSDTSVAINAVDGDSKIARTVEETLAVLSSPRPDAIGILLDADSQQLPAERFSAVRDALNQLGLTLSAQPGTVSPGPPRSGIFVIPDNQNAGTLEDLLIDCAQSNYPGLLAAAQTLVSGIQPGDPSLTAEDMRDFRKPAGAKKATVACIAGVLKPGKAIQVSIQDNRWLDARTLLLPRIQPVQHFMKALLGLP